MTSVAPADALQKSSSTGSLEKPQTPEPSEPDTSLQDSKRLGFAKSFNRLSTNFDNIQSIHPLNVSEKLKNTFVDFCGVVEKGVADALQHRFNVTHGITPLHRGLSRDVLGGSQSVNGITPGVDSPKSDHPLSNASGTEDLPPSTPLSQRQKQLVQSGSMNSLRHSRAASRGRQDAPAGQFVHMRSLHRPTTSSARVRSAGKFAACYFTKEESYKLRLTIEARIRCPPDIPALPKLPTLAVVPKGDPSQTSSPSLSREASAISLSPTPQPTPSPRIDPKHTLSKKQSTKSLQNIDSESKPEPPSVAEQAKDIRNAISAIITDMAEPIPGTPIIIMFNAIVYHEAMNQDTLPGAEPHPDYALAFSWKGEISTPCGSMIKELKQQRMEQAYKEQGVELDSVKAEAAAAAALAEQSTFVGKIKGLLKFGGSRSNLKPETSGSGTE
ncbi:hypothetical protein HDU98_010707 [Podochytrium sp. JEL0797]|nr:hypothetical protein HDU98_010707 [Podochytrium sp. JEL0797]